MLGYPITRKTPIPGIFNSETLDSHPGFSKISQKIPTFQKTFFRFFHTKNKNNESNCLPNSFQITFQLYYLQLYYVLPKYYLVLSNFLKSRNIPKNRFQSQKFQIWVFWDPGKSHPAATFVHRSPKNTALVESAPQNRSLPIAKPSWSEAPEKSPGKPALASTLKASNPPIESSIESSGWEPVQNEPPKVSIGNLNCLSLPIS